ncbi:transcriptional regulator with PAS, ATPase and Fis domain [Bacillus ectoiniformans]|nr:transcriptional regulator with PAS, ATPase and Fis domain [Bacillus ectoiniformans]
MYWKQLRKMIEEAYSEFKSTRRAAEELGITQSLLMRSVRKYGINLGDKGTGPLSRQPDQKV